MRGNKGFTLVEMAIVLVIIGIILGAVIKGQDLIAGAKEKKFKSEVDLLATAYYTYYDKYSRIPGDDEKATLHWTGAANGNNDGLIKATAEIAPDTGALDHLRRAGFIGDQPPGGTAFNSTAMPGVTMNFSSSTPTTTTDNNNITTTTSWGSKTNLIVISGMTAEDMLNFDIKYDDGDVKLGKVRGVTATTVDSPFATAYTAGTVLAYSVK